MLNLTGITVRLGGRTIIDEATAKLPPRGRIGLIGRNGAGKSTLVRVIAGQLEADGGSVSMPRGSRLGYIAQEAPGGDATPFETVLAADSERAALMAESESCADTARLADIHERLIAIDAHAAPSRAARILVGLGFDEDAQHRPLESFSGGWRMRVALAALLFSQPDLLLLDEPSNHLDLEAVLWLEDFLRSYPATILLVSHERDFLNNVVDHILRLSGGPDVGPVIRGDGVYICPDPAGAVVGATMERGVDDQAVDAGRVAALRQAAEALLPELAAFDARAETGVRAATPDGLPMAGPSVKPGVLLAVGARRNGWLLAPLVAQVIAAYVAGDDPGPFAARLDPRRFDKR